MAAPAKKPGKSAKNTPPPLWDELARRLADRLHDLAQKPKNALFTGDDAGLFSHKIHQQFQNIKLTSLTNPLLENALFDALVGPLPAANLPKVLAAALPRLAPDSPISMATLGAGSFAEIPNPPTLPDVRDIGDLLQKLKLSLPVIDRDTLTLTFASPAAAKRTFAAHGWPLPTSNNLNITKLTIEIIYIHAHTPSTNQPRPAARGSGKVSLVKILHNTSTT